MAAAEEPSLYARAGGEETFLRLASEFYDRVERDPLLRPMFVEETMDGPKERLALFLSMYFGGPPFYLIERGHPALPLRHARFAIGPAERDAWVQHMAEALDAIDVEDPERSEMLSAMARTAAFLTNRERSPNEEV